MSDPRLTGMRGAALAGLGLLVVAALVFTTASATQETADDGLTALRAEALIGADDVALKAVTQAVLLAEDREFGFADDDVVQQAIDEAEVRLDHILARANDLDAVAGTDTATEAADLVAAGANALEMAWLGDVDAVGDLLRTDLLARFELIRDRAAAVRTEAEVAIVGVGDVARRAADIMRFLAAFVLPLAAVIAYRFAARRQLKVAEIQLETRLAAEHEVIRAKDEFIANMSHELRTPLTSIFGFSEILLDVGQPDSEASMELVSLINTESAELGRMVEDLLVAARVEADALVYNFGEFNLAEEATTVIAPLARTGHEVGARLDDHMVWADPLRVRQMLRNLVSNAIRYGGDHIMVTAKATSDTVEITVADDGPGVPDEIAPRLFTRFVHDGDTALTVGSIGLGLAVVKSLADGMDATVEYERADGWTLFTITLPKPGRSAGDAPGHIDNLLMSGDVRTPSPSS